jgi:hypothetical protein
MKRREFIKLAAAAAPLVTDSRINAATGKVPYEDFLRESAVTKEVIDRFLRGPSWTRFDPELGYVLGNYLPLDGIDGSATISTIQANGARTSFMYAGRKCRINAYGDSFTQCHQVSDGRPAEYLASHLGDRQNFGMGGRVVPGIPQDATGGRPSRGRLRHSLHLRATSSELLVAVTPSPTVSGPQRGGSMFTATWSRGVDSKRMVEKKRYCRPASRCTG